MKIAIICLLLIVAPLVVAGQNVSLLAAECDAGRRGCGIHHLVRFHFRDGVLVSKEHVLTTDIARVRYDLGLNRIHRNRYVITNWSDVVDIQERRVLHDGQGDYVATEGDWVIERIDTANGHGYFYFDLARNQYRRFVEPTKWALPGELSPDQTKSVEGENDRIWLHSIGEKRKLLGTGFQISEAVEASFMPKPPLFWLDDYRILTQTSDGEIVVVRLSGSVTPIGKFPVKGPNYSQPYFFRNRDGRIIYVCGGGAFVIDVAHKAFAPYEWIALGFGFDAERNANESYGSIIRHEGKEIGRLWANAWHAPATDGYAAFEYGDVGSNLGYPKGIKVWSRATGKWTTINNRRLTALIGWVRE
jgi:hypothetical protein